MTIAISRESVESGIEPFAKTIDNGKTPFFCQIQQHLLKLLIQFLRFKNVNSSMSTLWPTISNTNVPSHGFPKAIFGPVQCYFAARVIKCKLCPQGSIKICQTWTKAVFCVTSNCREFA